MGKTGFSLENKEILETRAFLYYNQWYADNILKIASKFEEEFGEIFDGERSVLPHSKDAPAGFPRIILKSEKEEKVLYIGQTDGEIRLQLPQENLNFMKDLVMRLAKLSVAEFNWGINDLGIGSRYKLILKNGNPLEFLDKFIVKQKIHESPKKIEYESSNIINWQGTKVRERVMISNDDEELIIFVFRGLEESREDNIELSKIEQYFDFAIEGIQNSVEKIIRLGGLKDA